MMQFSGPVPFTVLVLLLLLASWLLGYYVRGRERLHRAAALDPDYFSGLNYLLNDEPDDAVDVFIDALEVNGSTFETHLALGKLLRRRGKVDRAIEHFQGLLASRCFNGPQMAELRLQLMRSYLAAGLLDRAEQLLIELRQLTSSSRTEALRLAIMLYQMEKEWHAALDAAAELLKVTPAQHRHDLLLQMTHFHCELAEAALARGETDLAAGELCQALQLFKGNVRVYMLAARLEMQNRAPEEACALLFSAIRVDPTLFREIAPVLREAAVAAGMEQTDWLPQRMESELGTDPAYLCCLAEQARQQQDGRSCVEALLRGLEHAPSLPLLRRTLEAAAEEGCLEIEALRAGAGVLALQLGSLPRYRCEHCGFELRNLHWSCPGCSCWGMVKPINTLIVAAGDSNQH